MENQVQNILLQRKWAGRYSLFGRTWLQIAAGIAMRALIFFIGCVVTGWLLYQYAWIPLHGEVGVPAGVGEDNPALESNKLQTIISHQSDRLKYKSPGYEKQGRLFTIQEQQISE